MFETNSTTYVRRHDKQILQSRGCSYKRFASREAPVDHAGPILDTTNAASPAGREKFIVLDDDDSAADRPLWDQFAQQQSRAAAGQLRQR